MSWFLWTNFDKLRNLISELNFRTQAKLTRRIIVVNETRTDEATVEARTLEVNTHEVKVADRTLGIKTRQEDTRPESTLRSVPMRPRPRPSSFDRQGKASRWEIRAVSRAMAGRCAPAMQFRSILFISKGLPCLQVECPGAKKRGMSCKVAMSWKKSNCLNTFFLKRVKMFKIKNWNKVFSKVKLYS